MTTQLYVPGTKETDPAKIIRSQQLVAGQTATNTDAISALQNGTVTTIAGNSGAFTLNGTSGITNTTNDIKISQASSSQFGAVKVDNTTITAASGVISNSIAAKADQTTATSATKSVTPSVQQNHPSAAKAWVKFTGSASNGNQTIGDSFNVTSVSRTVAGSYTVTFTTAFTSTSYCCVGSSHAAGATNGFVQFSSLATGSVNAGFINILGPAAFDPTLGATLVFFGTE